MTSNRAAVIPAIGSVGIRPAVIRSQGFPLGAGTTR